MSGLPGYQFEVFKKAVSVKMFDLSSLPGDGAVNQQVSEAADGA